MQSGILTQAVNFVVNIPEVAKAMQARDAQPHRFAIYSITAAVTDYNKHTIRVVLNYQERSNPNFFREDIAVDIQGAPGNFEVINMAALEVGP